MKKGILLLLVAVAFTARAQTLKDLLYSGKLKNDSNTVIRKTDDLKSKIDTGQKKEAAAVNLKTAAAAADSTRDIAQSVTDSVTAEAEAKDSVMVAEAAKESTVPAKSNGRIWKEYTDSLISSLKAEVLSSRKIKKETYYITVEYEIDTSGQADVLNVVSSPENELLQQQVRERMLLTPPQLNVVTDSAGKPRKVKKRHNFNITKE